MVTVTVNASKTYDIQIGAGLLINCGEKIKMLHHAKTVVVVTDDNVAKLHLSKVTQSLTSVGYQVLTYVTRTESSRRAGNSILRFWTSWRKTV